MIKSTSDYYFHLPGTPSLGSVLDVGLRCTHSCKFCYYSFWDSLENQFQALRKGVFRSLPDCLDILTALSKNGLKHVDVTGGEPTLHPGIVDMARHAKELELGFRIITLGQFLMQHRSRGKSLLGELLEAGTSDFLFSIHAVDENNFRSFTGGSWEKLSSAMQFLNDAGFQYGANTVVFRDNLSMLPEIARVVASRGAYTHNFILFNAYHRWANVPKITRMQPRFQEIEGPLRKAIDILVETGIAVNIRFAPLCVFPGLEKHIVGVVGIPYDPYEWRNRACNYDKHPSYCSEPIPIDGDGTLFDYRLIKKEKTLRSGQNLIAERGKGIKVFPQICEHCAAITLCDGVDPRYFDLHGSEELTPYTKFGKTGTLPNVRLTYKAPFTVKLKPFANMKSIISS